MGAAAAAFFVISFAENTTDYSLFAQTNTQTRGKKIVFILVIIDTFIYPKRKANDLLCIWKIRDVKMKCWSAFNDLE